MKKEMICVKNFIKALFIAGIILVVTGVILIIIKKGCYNMPPQEFFESKVCSHVVGYSR